MSVSNIWNVHQFKNSAEIRLNGFVGRWDAINSRQFIRDLNALETKFKRIDVSVSSMGGEVLEGLDIYTAMKKSPADIYVTVENLAASIASVFLLGAKKENRSIMQSGFVMTHEASSRVSGNAAKLKEEAEVLAKINNTLIDIYVKETGQPKSVVETWMQSGKNKWFNAQEAVDAGLVNQIVPDKGNQTASLSKDMSGEDLKNYFATLETPHQQPDLKQKSKPKMEKIIAELGLTAGANQEEVVIVVAEMKRKKAEDQQLIARLQTENKQFKADAEKAEKDAKKAKVDVLITAALDSGKITADQKTSFEKLAMGDYDETKKILDAMKPVESIVKQIQEANKGKGSPNAKFDTMDWDELEKTAKGSKQLAWYKENDWDHYAELFEDKYGKEPTKK